MKALVYMGPMDMRYMDVETPEPKPGEVLLKVKAVSICGSDLTGYKGQSIFRVPPLIMGHEFSGEIAKLGDNVKGLNVGDRVIVETNLYCGYCADCKAGFSNVCDNRKIIGTTMKAGSYNGAMAEYVVAPAEKIIPLPDNVTFNAAALTEPLAISLRATKHAGDLRGKTVVVYGAGPIGLLTIQCVKFFGAERIIAIDVVEDRLEMAKKCGATDVINSKEDVAGITRKMTDGVGVDVVFDAVGVPETVNGGVEIVRNGGKVVWIGLGVPKLEFDYKHAVCKEITFYCSYMYTTELKEGLDMIATGRMNVEQIITGIYPMSEGPRIFEELASRKSKDIKVILVND
ncbi:zinc-dependent alcohol dehydrogenase [Thermovenabulum gondwanense]|uniref:D-arabitol-phosphate dehydrogenase n=1 Tax=Thermovenabulum gondwanense TaxID=520767 RepID=A0A162MXF4_9FIRM|nr:galactitol-1-phosphate 5-dehydrogenase [Thermovenabulum gondwanense]KYO68075.1 D-arabitol-phosphate dehydrogenase [Thermovenabulum gondwanense]